MQTFFLIFGWAPALFWGLPVDFCQDGSEQSPIEIRLDALCTKTKDSCHLKPTYEGVEGQLIIREESVEFNSEAPFGKIGNTMEARSLQIFFPAQHVNFDGRAEGEVQITFEPVTGQGRKLVLVCFIRVVDSVQRPNTPNLSALINGVSGPVYWPAHEGFKQPEDSQCFSYMGSQMGGSCEEYLEYVIMQDTHLEVLYAHIRKFVPRIHRPIQPLYLRRLFVNQAPQPECLETDDMASFPTRTILQVTILTWASLVFVFLGVYIRRMAKQKPD